MLDSILGFIGKGIDAWSSASNTEKNNATQLRIAQENIANQREFAQQGIRWKVADAQAAGLHPLAALGAQVSSYSPVSVGDLSVPRTDFGGMGQDIGRAIDAGSTQAERTDRMGAAITRTAQVFSLEKMNLENEILKTQLAKSVAQLPPAVPASGLAHLSRSPLRTSEGIAVDDDPVKQKAGDMPSQKSYKFMGIPLQTNRNFSDGQVVEDRLGDSEVVSTITAIANILADLQNTYGRRTFLGRGNKGPRVFPYFDN